MKELYNSPIAEFVEFDEADVIATSGCLGVRYVRYKHISGTKTGCDYNEMAPESHCYLDH